MRKMLRTVICFALALCLTCLTGPAALAVDEDRAVLPEPQDLKTLFPHDAIVTKDYGDFTISYPDSLYIEPGLEADEITTILVWIYDTADVYESKGELSIVLTDVQEKVNADYLAAKLEDRLNYFQDSAERLAKSGIDTQNLSSTGSIVNFKGKKAACTIVYADHPNDSSYTNYYELHVPLGEKGTYTFTITTNERRLSDLVVLFSILDTVKWKD